MFLHGSSSAQAHREVPDVSLPGEARGKDGKNNKSMLLRVQWEESRGI